MIEIIDKKKCSGCEACANACPVDAIVMSSDAEGFLYPRINKKKCIGCDKCEKICPVINHDAYAKTVKSRCIYKEAYGAKTKESEMRRISSSGGLFFSIANRILDEGGVVIAAAFDDSFQVEHRVAQTKNELISLIGSKYVQSRVGFIYRETKKYLTDGRDVLFVGLSCQIEGLNAYLGKEYGNLYLIDLICMGIPSPGVWHQYIEQYFSEKEIRSINFKDKTQGWHKFSVAIDFTDDTHFLQTGNDNYFMQAMFKSYSIRPSCFACLYKSELKCSDITIADCWGCEKYLPEMDDDKGTSMMIIHSDKGKELLRKIQNDIEMESFDYHNVLEFNKNYNNCTKQRRGRWLFYKLINGKHPKIGFELMCKNPKNSYWNKCTTKLKSIIK